MQDRRTLSELDLLLGSGFCLIGIFGGEKIFIKKPLGVGSTRLRENRLRRYLSRLVAERGPDVG